MSSEFQSTDVRIEEEQQEGVNSAEFKKYVGVEAARRALRRNVHFGDNTILEYDPNDDFTEFQKRNDEGGGQRVPLTPVDGDRPPTRGILSRSSTSARRPPRSPRRGKPTSPLVQSRGGRNFMLVASEQSGVLLLPRAVADAVDAHERVFLHRLCVPAAAWNGRRCLPVAHTISIPSSYLMALPKTDPKKLRSFEVERRDTIEKRKSSDASADSKSIRRLSESFGKNDGDLLMFDKLKDVLSEVHQEIQRRSTISNIEEVRAKPSSVNVGLMNGEWAHNNRPEAYKFK
uniref:Uncharacterized protein n=1 Tax=Plectus sambesii TaxID=2011161 RepID=A0A914XJY0_9BILA